MINNSDNLSVYYPTEGEGQANLHGFDRNVFWEALNISSEALACLFTFDVLQSM